MCKTRFDSQRMILNSFSKKKTFLKKNVNGRSPPPFMAYAIKNFHFVFRNPSLRKATFTLSKSFEILPGRLPSPPCVISLKLFKKLDIEVFLHTQKMFLHMWGIFDLREIIESRYSVREIFISWMSLSAARQSNWNIVWQIRLFI